MITHLVHVFKKDTHQLASSSSMLPMISSSPLSGRGVLLCFLVFMAVSVSTTRASVASVGIRKGVGALISGVGPEKSFPVKRVRVAISVYHVSFHIKQLCMKRSCVPYGMRFFRQYVIRAGSLLSSALNLFLQALRSRPGRTYEMSS